MRTAFPVGVKQHAFAVGVAGGDGAGDPDVLECAGAGDDIAVVHFEEDVALCVAHLDVLGHEVAHVGQLGEQEFGGDEPLLFACHPVALSRASGREGRIGCVLDVGQLACACVEAAGAAVAGEHEVAPLLTVLPLHEHVVIGVFVPQPGKGT